MRKLFVGGLSWGTTDDNLFRHFEGAGNVVSAKIIMDRETGRSKGFGFIEMGTDEEAQKAITMFNGREFEGRNITVNEAKPQTPRDSRSGGGYGRSERW